MAITVEIEVLRQQFKGKGMYTVPLALLSMSNIKPSNNVHFQPIDPAHKSPVQTMDQSLLNSSLNLLDNLAATDPYHVDKQHPKDPYMQVTVLYMQRYPMHHNLMYHLLHM